MSKKAKKKIAKRHLKSVKSKSPAKGKGKSKSGAAASTTTRDRCVELLTFSRKTLNKYIDTVPADKATAQGPACPNHALWTFGHLAATAAWGLSTIGGPKNAVPESYDKLFGMGSTPTADASAYPSLAEVKKAYEDTHAKLLAAARGMTDAQLKTPVEAGGFATDRADLLFKLAWHEAWHLGQIADLRRALGLPAM